MLNTIVASILNWLAASVLVPMGVWLGHYWLLKKENAELKKAVAALKNAQTPKAKDEAVDNIP